VTSNCESSASSVLVRAPGDEACTEGSSARAICMRTSSRCSHRITEYRASSGLQSGSSSGFGASASNPSLAPIGSSDFHFGGALGLCRTYLLVDEISERGVLEAVREGRTVAYDSKGHLTGDPARVRAVQALVSHRPPPPGADLASRAASWISLAGLLVVLLFR
jgi:hypothetical protein